MRALFGTLAIVSPLLGFVTNASGAQVLPGGRGSSANEMRTGHSRYVRREVDATLERLQAALNAGRSDKVSELYTSDASILTATGTLLQGRGAVRDRYERALSRIRGVGVVVQTFEASGALAYVLGTMRYDVKLSTGGALHVEGPVSFVLREERIGWGILSQTGGELPSTIVPHAALPERAEASDTIAVGVRITDASGLIVPNVLVAFESEAGDARVWPGAVLTNAAGIAMATVKLGAEPGLNVVRATAAGVIGEPVFFSIRVVNNGGP